MTVVGWPAGPELIVCSESRISVHFPDGRLLVDENSREQPGNQLPDLFISDPASEAPVIATNESFRSQALRFGPVRQVLAADTEYNGAIDEFRASLQLLHSEIGAFRRALDKNRILLELGGSDQRPQLFYWDEAGEKYQFSLHVERQPQGELSVNSLMLFTHDGAQIMITDPQLLQSMRAQLDRIVRRL